MVFRLLVKYIVKFLIFKDNTCIKECVANIKPHLFISPLDKAGKKAKLVQLITREIASFTYKLMTLINTIVIKI